MVRLPGTAFTGPSATSSAGAPPAGMRGPGSEPFLAGSIRIAWSRVSQWKGSLRIQPVGVAESPWIAILTLTVRDPVQNSGIGSPRRGNGCYIFLVCSPSRLLQGARLFVLQTSQGFLKKTIFRPFTRQISPLARPIRIEPGRISGHSRPRDFRSNIGEPASSIWWKEVRLPVLIPTPDAASSVHASDARLESQIIATLDADPGRPHP